MSQVPYSVIEIPGFTLDVHLGCLPDERVNTQEVDVYIKIAFGSELSAEKTDALEETVCYAQLAEKVQKMTQGQEYKLIEKMARDAYNEILPMLPGSSRLQVKIHKLRPPIDLLKRGVYYTTGDLSL